MILTRTYVLFIIGVWFIRRDNCMEEQKETYKQMLHEIIDSMDNADNLLYLIIFIQEKFKAG